VAWQPTWQQNSWVAIAAIELFTAETGRSVLTNGYCGTGSRPTHPARPLVQAAHDLGHAMRTPVAAVEARFRQLSRWRMDWRAGARACIPLYGLTQVKDGLA
jgi:hypothetical protein